MLFLIAIIDNFYFFSFKLPMVERVELGTLNLASPTHGNLQLVHVGSDIDKY